MATSQYFAVMRLMEKLKDPSSRYNRSVRRFWRNPAGSTEKVKAIEEGNAALLEIEAIVREWVAATPAPAPDAAEVVLPPTTRLSYRLEHRSKGETTWRQGHPFTGLRWTYADRERADQRLVEMRAQYPQYEYRMVTITTTVTETVEETR